MELQVFKHEQFGELRTVEIDGTPYFVGKDVAERLGYSNASKALQDHVDEEDKLNNETLLSLGQRGGWLINESGLYSLVLSSKLPQAKQFKRWVTSEILPSIRKHGIYATEYLLENPDVAIAAFQALKEEREKNKQLETKILEQSPKVLFADSVSSSNTSILVGDLAKLIKQNSYDMGQKRLFEWLRANGWLIKQKGDSWNMPTQKSMQMGLFEIKERTVNNPDGSIRVTKTPKVTGKGQVFFIEQFLGTKGVTTNASNSNYKSGRPNYR